MIENNPNNNEPGVTYQDLQNNSVNSEINVVNTEKTFEDKTIQTVESMINTHDHVYEYTPEEVNKYKKLAILAYIPFVVLYFILTKKYKESRYLLFHTNQGIIVSSIWLIAIIVQFIFNSLFGINSEVTNSTPVLFSFIIYVLYCISFILSIFGIVNTMNGKSKELYLIGNIKILK